MTNWRAYRRGLRPVEDNIGRDQLSRLPFAGQVSLGIAFVGAGLRDAFDPTSR